MSLLVIGSDRAAEFAETVKSFAPDRDVRLWPDTGNVADIRYALAWKPEPGELAKCPNLELLVSVGAGVDHLFSDPDLPEVTLVRYVDPDLTTRMVQYVVLHSLYHVRRMTEYQSQQRRSEWTYLPEPMPGEVRIGIMGIGVLGQAAGAALANLGYKVNGWSRTPKDLPGMTCYAGDEGRSAFLAATDILVVLLPLTPATRGIVKRELLGGLSREGRHRRLPGPVLINAGRGALQVEEDIQAAIEAGELYAASLDVFTTEPLPSTSPLWQNERIVITPHNAAESSPESIARYFLRQVERVESGQPPENIVDPKMQY